MKRFFKNYFYRWESSEIQWLSNDSHWEVEWSDRILCWQAVVYYLSYVHFPCLFSPKLVLFSLLSFLWICSKTFTECLLNVRPPSTPGNTRMGKTRSLASRKYNDCLTDISWCPRNICPKWSFPHSLLKWIFINYLLSL